MVMTAKDADLSISLLQDCGYNADYSQEPVATFLNPFGLVNVTATKDNFYRVFWSLGEVKQFCNNH